MSAYTAILEADADGTLHVPLPAELLGAKVRISAKLELVTDREADEQQARRKRALDALKTLQERGTFDGLDVVAWQREIRKDRPLPGRDE